MDAKFYIKNLTNPSKQNSGEGNETDPIKRYLNQLAAKAIENEASYFDILDFEHPSPTVLEKNFYTTLLQQSQVNINSENKIGDENNYEFVIMEYPDNIEDYFGNQKELFEHSKFTFLNEENAKYFLNKFIKISTKQFIKSNLYSIDFENIDFFSDLDITAKTLEENIETNNFKFGIHIDPYINETIVIDDIDLQAFYNLRRMGDNEISPLFDENENKIIFNIITDTYGVYDEYHIMSFIFSNSSSNSIITKNINETNYKILIPRQG